MCIMNMIYCNVHAGFIVRRSCMSRIARNGLIIVSVVIIVLGLVIFFIIRLTPGTKPGGSVESLTTATLTRVSGTAGATNISTKVMTPLPTQPQLLQLSSDPYTNGTSQHRTAVEPASYSYGSTIVAAFQVGRFTDHGSSNIAWAT